MRDTPTVLRPWRRFFEPPPIPAEQIEVRTRDGLRLALHRVCYPNAGAAVLLVHGLAANRNTFHFPGRSLADWLARRGFDCYVAELRGHGKSERRAFDWDLDDYLKQDLPAIIDAILERSGQSQLSWIGHSMGGILLFCYGILNPSAPIVRGITIGSAFDYRPGRTGFHGLVRLLPILRRVPAVPYGTFTHLIAPLLGRTADPLTAFNFWPSNAEQEVVRCAHATAFHTIPTSLLSNLGQLFEEAGLRARDGFSYRDHLEQYRVPTLMLAGSRDAQVSVAAVERAAELFGGELRLFGRNHGHADEYGHWDLILGRRAFEEVWPAIGSWLSEDVNASSVSEDVNASSVGARAR